MDLPGTIVALPFYLAILVVLGIVAINKRFSFIYTLMWLSFALKGLFILFDYAYDLIPLTEDAYKFDDYAWQVALFISGKGGFAIIKALQYEPGYTVPVGFLYWIFGHHPEIPALFNALFTTLTIWNIYRIALIFFNNQRGAKAVAFLYSLSPYIAIMSIYIWRDALINYLISQLIYILIINSKAGKTIYTIPILLLTFYIGFLRPENLVLIVGIFIIYSFYTILKERRSLMWPIKLMAFISVIGVILVIIYTMLAEHNLFRHFQDFADLTYLANRGEKASARGGAYLQGYKITSWADLVLFFPLKLIYFLYVPFPWDLTKKSYIIFSADAQLLLLTYFLSIKGIIYIIKSKSKYGIILLLYLFLGIGGSAILSSNIPGAQRHRTQFTFIIFILASYSVGLKLSSAQQPYRNPFQRTLRGKELS